MSDDKNSVFILYRFEVAQPQLPRKAGEIIKIYGTKRQYIQTGFEQ